jgi:hypothetical protein
MPPKRWHLFYYLKSLRIAIDKGIYDQVTMDQVKKLGD